MNSALPSGNHPPHINPGESGAESPFQQKYKFTSEERKVLRECNKESFWLRSVPIGTILASGVYTAVKSGFLSPNARWGPAPKMFGAAMVGYFIGKISYQRTCAEKIMQLPNSQLADYLRKQRGGRGMGFQEVLTLESESFGTPILSGSSSDPVSSPGTSGTRSSDISDTRAISSFDNESHTFYSNIDIGKPVDEQMMNDDNLPPPRPQNTATYDDLRRQNRIDYETQRHQPPPAPPLSMDQSRRPRFAPASPAAPPQPISKTKNEYGDVWEEST
ncbi:unnamed protein product [Allacma fusca]|uniref:OCIA domain-containing protein n=1 Tax=Allacma fusca TaxID=39272 RepID=A0A8J2JW25_9HEXA|nr:unnamed protein product [Allacma fusca]